MIAVRPTLQTRTGSESTSSKRAGGAEVELGVGDDRVDAALDHLQPGADRGAPELREGDVEIEQVVGVEDDPLRVALAVADAQLVDELLGHG